MEDTYNDMATYATPTQSSAMSSVSNDFFPNCDEDLIPYSGMIFDSLQEGVDFYKRYAHHVGFSVRLSSETKRNGVICWKYCVCAKEGWHKEKEADLIELELPIDVNNRDVGNDIKKMGAKKIKAKRRRMLTREGCMARCIFKRTTTDKFEVSKVHVGHTHSLATPSKIPMLRSTREVNPILKNMLRACHRNNVGTSKAYNLMKEQIGGSANVGCIKRDLQNFHRDLKGLIENSDAHMFIENFRRMKTKNPSFYFAYEIDEKDRIKHVFWADGISRKNYYLFGDAMSFDTTYGTNKYSLIFAPFTGINHHRQSITFGAGFIANEKVESFVWLFEKFLEAVGDHQPVYIVTDQDPAMKVAIGRVFHTSVHRFCVWHIMRKVSEKVGGVLNSDSKFHSKLKSCVWGCETPDEFESTWLSIISDYGLLNNDWFNLMYGLRHMWIPAYFHDISLAGLLRTTSRSESENSMFSKFVNKQLSLVEFWMRFDCAIENQRDREGEFDHTNSSSMPQLRTDLHIEKRGRQVYTHMNFYIFQDELWSSTMDCVILKIHEDDEIRGFTILDSDKECYKSKREVFYYTSTSEARCSCKMFELEGIPCRHILVAIRGDLKKEIPSALILNRWTKTATQKPIFDDHGMLLETCVKEKSKAQLVTSAWASFYELMHCAEQSEEDLKMVAEVCSSMKKRLTLSSEKQDDKTHDLESFVGCSLPEEVEIHPPKPSSTKGSGKRIKRGKEVAMEQQERHPRLCKCCGQMVYHDSRNCPIKGQAELSS